MSKIDTLEKYIVTESFEELSALNSQLIFGWIGGKKMMPL
jgi:hypothetical protein